MPELKKPELPVVKCTVERVKIKEFAEAIGDPNKVYLDKDFAIKENYRGIIAPPTFGVCISGSGYYEMFDIVNINMEKILHGEQKFEYFGEINAGDEITVISEVAADIEKHGKRGKIRIVDLQHTYLNQRGEKVLVSNSIFVEQG